MHNILDSPEEFSPGRSRECACFLVATQRAGQVARAKDGAASAGAMDGEGRGLRFDGRTSANRALLVSPPPRGADCPQPVSAPMLDRSDYRIGLLTSCTHGRHKSMP
jgi:hypothetical protein